MALAIANHFAWSVITGIILGISYAFLHNGLSVWPWQRSRKAKTKINVDA